VRHAIAAGVINIHHIAGKKNPADVLSKHWDLPSVWNAMKPLLFWNWKSVAPDTAGTKEESNIEAKDVAELVSKLNTKHNVKVTTQGKGQKSNHSLIEGSDKGAISSVIQSMNQSRARVPSYGPGSAVNPKDKDARSNLAHKKEVNR